jgi:glycosyltransferase involved in cell wall biosynthesis
MNKKNLGIAVIVKNGGATLGKALASVSDLSNQIIVVDTGSEDDSVSIATRFGAEVHFFEWSNDFAAARNFVLGKMRTEWILSLDADEELAADTKIEDLILDDKVGGVRLQILNTLDGGKSVYSHKYTRLFRNDSRIRYTGKIHEQINESIFEAGYEIVDSDMKILHSGYADNSPEKIDRNRELLIKELEKNPDDSWIKFHLGETEFSSKEYARSKKLFEEALSSGQLSQEQTEKARIRLAQIAISSDEIDRIEELLRFVSQNKEMEGFRKYILSSAYLLSQRFREANELLNDEDVMNSLMVDKDNLEKARLLLSKTM